jgi:phage tail-like protein
MAILRADRPYVQFNFLVYLDDGMEKAPAGGFQEMSGIGMEVTVSEYRNGNSNENHVIKVTGLNKSTDVTCKRGVIGSLNLYNWLNDIRLGQQYRKNVTIELWDETHTQAVMRWRLMYATIIKYTSGPFNAKGTDVAMEELVLAYEMLKVE